MKKLIYLIVLTLILGLVLTGCLLSNVGQVPTTGQKGMPLSTANLVALWHFDEDSGAIAYDSTANGNDGTISGTSWVDGKLGKALNFDGNDYVIVPDSSLLEPDRITVEAWVKKSGTPGSYRYIVSKYLPTKPGSYSSYGLYTASSGGLRFYIGLSSTWVASPDAGTGVWDGNWHHVAGTYDGSAVKLYVDGELVAGAGSTTSDIEYEGTGNLFIGAYTTASYCFSGTIDEVRIWDGALTADEILYSYADETLHVDDDWAQWPGAYYTINEALAVAGNGDTIKVHEGTYNEVLPINTPNLTIQSTAGAANTIIDAGGVSTVVSITADGVTFSGFTLQNAGGVNVRGIDMAGPISGCNISDIAIKNSTSTSSIYGVLAVQVNASTFSNLAISNLNHTGGSGGAYGIGLNTSDDNTFTNNTISNFNGGADAQGVLLNNNCDGNTFTNTAISGLISTSGYPCGITIWEKDSEPSSNNNTFVATTISNLSGASSVYGIQNRANAGYEHIGNSFNDTHISGLTSTGDIAFAIYNEYVKDTVLTDTYISDITANIVAIGINNALTFDNTLISGGEIQGFSAVVWSAGVNFARSSSTASVEGMTITGATYGIRISGTADASQVEVHYNNIMGNTGYGIFNDGAEVVDATLNWWGDVSGPYHPTSWYWGLLEITNPSGLGDEVNDKVLYMPWLGMGGFVTGGGTIWSGAGNYRWDVDAEGQANFGFVSKYKKGKNVPDGSTNFVFQAGDLHFHSSSYDWLVVTGSDYAMFKGTGTINDSGEYKFRIWAGDGGKGGEDTFRIKIWEEGEDSIEDVVYDNGTDQVIDSGSIIIHTK